MIDRPAVLEAGDETITDMVDQQYLEFVPVDHEVME